MKKGTSRHILCRLLGGGALAGALCVALLAVLPPIGNPQIAAELTTRASNPDHGAYVAVLGDCVACHTVPGGVPFAGGRSFSLPFGTIFSPNITPNREFGIGRYNFGDFVRLMRFGVKPDGTRVYPAMPYTAYAKVSDTDLEDLFAWLRGGVKPSSQPNIRGTAPWPLSMRWPLIFWNAAFLDANRFKPSPQHDAVWNRGAYLVQGLTHCGTCHTPRGIFLEEKDTSGRTNLFLSGTSLDASFPIDLRGNEASGLGLWTTDEIANVLGAGRVERFAVSGQMAEVVEHSTQFIMSADLRAIATYLKSLEPAPGQTASFVADRTTYAEYLAGKATTPGARIYMDSCAACHRLSGQGEPFVFPKLSGNTSLLSRDASSLIAIIIGGGRVPSTALAQSGLAMPGFGWRYSDEDLAQLATFVRNAWGNHAGRVTSTQVHQVRALLSLDKPLVPRAELAK